MPWIGSLPDHLPMYICYCLAIATFLFCGSWMWLASRYYRRRFGRVESKPQSGRAYLFGLAYGAGYFLCTLADNKNSASKFCRAFLGILSGHPGSGDRRYSRPALLLRHRGSLRYDSRIDAIDGVGRRKSTSVRQSSFRNGSCRARIHRCLAAGSFPVGSDV